MQGPVTVDSPAPFEAGPEAEQASPLQSRAVRTGLAIAVLLVLAILGGVLIHWWTIGRFVQSTNDAFLQADQVSVAPKVAGYVEQVMVADNQDVAAGQPLVRIDAREAQARLDQSRAQVEQAQASIRQAEAQIAAQQAQIEQAKAQAAGARAAASFARVQVARYGPLSGSGAETAEHLDQLRQNRDQTESQARAAAAQVLGAQRQIETLKAQIGVAQAQGDQARAQARQAQVDVDAAIVRASISGRVGDRTVRTGQYVQPGVRLMSVVPVQALYLTANFKETQIGRMRPGQPVKVKVDALSGREIRGVVDSFAPGTGAQFALIPPSNATGNFTKIVQRVPVRIRIEAPADLRPVLLPGLSADVEVDTRNLERGRRQASLNGAVG